MAKLPDKIKTEFQTNEGYTHQIPDRDLLDALITGFNELIEYLKDKED